MAVQGSRNEDKITPYLDPNQQDLLLAALNAQAQDKSGQAKQNANMSGNALFMSPQDAQLDNLDYTPDLDYLDGDNSFDFDNADLGGEMIGALPARTSLDEGHEKRKSRDEGDAADEGDAKRQETQDGERTGKKPGRKPLTNEPTTKRKAQNRAAQRAFRERKEKHLKDLETKVSELSKTHEADQHENGMLKAQVERLQVELREYRKRLSLNSGAARSSPPLTAYTGQNRSASNSLSGGNFQFDFPKFGALPGSQMFGSQENLPDSSNNGVLQRGSVTPPLSNSQSPQSFHGKGSIPPAQFSNTDSQHSQGGRSISPATNLSRSGSNAPTPPQKYGNFPAVGYSTNDNMHGFASTLPQMNSENPFGDLFSPTLLKNANFDNQNGYFNNAHQSNNNAGSALKSTYDVGNGGESTAGLNRVFQFNGGSSSSDSASPSASSTSQWNANANSSCGTSPEPAHDSPAAKAQHQDSYSSEKSTSLRNGTTAQTQYNSQAASGGNPNIALVGNSLDYSVPTTNTFDPVLFGDYRDNPDNLFGTTTDFGTNAFFDDALNTAPFDYGSPSNLFGILQSPQQTHDTLSTGASPAANAPTPSRNLMAVMDKARDGGDDDYGLPTTMTQQPQKKVDASGGKLISCNNIWNQLQSNPDFQNGTFDLDSLCSELRAKARCSESGVMVSQDHVDAALKKLGKKDEAGRFVPNREKMDLPPLMFEQESWDNVLKKLGGSAQ